MEGLLVRVHTGHSEWEGDTALCRKSNELGTLRNVCRACLPLQDARHMGMPCGARSAPVDLSGEIVQCERFDIVEAKRLDVDILDGRGWRGGLRARDLQKAGSDSMTLHDGATWSWQGWPVQCVPDRAACSTPHGGPAVQGFWFHRSVGQESQAPLAGSG